MIISQILEQFEYLNNNEKQIIYSELTRKFPSLKNELIIIHLILKRIIEYFDSYHHDKIFYSLLFQHKTIYKMVLNSLNLENQQEYREIFVKVACQLYNEISDDNILMISSFLKHNFKTALISVKFSQKGKNISNNSQREEKTEIFNLKNKLSEKYPQEENSNLQIALRIFTLTEQNRICFDFTDPKLEQEFLASLQITKKLKKEQNFSASDIISRLSQYRLTKTLFYHSKLGIYQKLENFPSNQIKQVINDISQKYPSWFVLLKKKYGDLLVENKILSVEEEKTIENILNYIKEMLAILSLEKKSPKM